MEKCPSFVALSINGINTGGEIFKITKDPLKIRKCLLQDVGLAID